MTPLHLPRRFFRDDAVRYFTRPRWYRLFGLLGRAKRPVEASAPGARTLPRLECLWMPCYLVEFATEMMGQTGMVGVAVDGWSGFIVLSDRKKALLEGEAPGESFPPLLTAEEAVETARKGLFQVIMRRRGQLAKPEIREATEVLPFHTPYWVYYHGTLRGGIGVKIMDGYTGNPCGGQIRHAVLNALVAKRRGRLASRDNG